MSNLFMINIIHKKKFTQSVLISRTNKFKTCRFLICYVLFYISIVLKIKNKIILSLENLKFDM